MPVLAPVINIFTFCTPVMLFIGGDFKNLYSAANLTICHVKFKNG
ncbi:hypothetical protein J622_02841 [Acinetobacter sp. 1564232]|nr:hypothetical protein J622_02841 [Acinetobacter sp. 1564232]